MTIPFFILQADISPRGGSIWLNIIKLVICISVFWLLFLCTKRKKAKENGMLNAQPPIQSPASFSQNQQVHKEEQKESRPISFCSSCGSKLKPGARFCSNCGNSVMPQQGNS